MARDGQRLERLQDGLRFFAPEREVLVFPAWDCLPYDRVSPHPDIVAERLETLVRLAQPRKPGAPARVILASVGAALQKVPPRSLYAEAAVVLKKGQTVDANWLTKFLGENGYGRSETVMEPGEFAVRGGLVDLFPPGTAEPLRLDLFGDVLEEIRSFDPMSQRSTGTREEVVRAAGERGAARPRTASRASAAAIASCSATPATIRSTKRCRPASAMSAWSTGCRCSTNGWRRCSTTAPRRWSPPITRSPRPSRRGTT